MYYARTHRTNKVIMGANETVQVVTHLIRNFYHLMTVQYTRKCAKEIDTFPLMLDF